MTHPAVKVLKPLSLVLMGITLMLAGLFAAVYSPWFQDAARQALLQALNAKPDTQFSLEDFSIRFPLDIKLRGLQLVQHGDTMMRAKAFDAKVKLLPLLGGEIAVDDARLSHARYQMGTRDSATCIVITADDVRLDPAAISLNPMHISVDNAAMTSGTVDIYINPCPPPAPKSDEPASPLLIDARNIELRDFTYRMNMMPVIDSLGTHIDFARLTDGHIDLTRQTVDIARFAGHGLNATYIVPDSAAIAATIVRSDSTASEPWTVRVDAIDFDSVQALYTTRGYIPTPGLDFGYIALERGSLNVENFYNRATDVTLPVSIAGTERCGVDLRLSGVLKVSETRLNFDNILMATDAGTRLCATGMMGIGNPLTEPALPLDIVGSGSAACSDLALMFPFMNPYVAGLPAASTLDVDIDARGSMQQLDISRLTLNVDRSISLDASGSLTDVNDPLRMGGDIAFRGSIGNISPWHKILAATLGDIAVPPLSLDGDITFNNGNYSGHAQARTARGSLALDGELRGRGNVYDISLSADRFPVDAFMPALGVGEVTADIDAHGHGFDFFSPATAADLSMQIDHATINGHTLANIVGNASLADGNAAIDLSSHNPAADFDLKAAGNLTGAKYDWTAEFDSRALDLHALGLVEAPMAVAGRIDATASIDAKHFTNFSANIDIPHLVYTDSVGPLKMNDIRAIIDASPDHTGLSLYNGDLYAIFSAECSLDSLMLTPASLMASLDSHQRDRRIDIEDLQHRLPPFSLDIDGGKNNIVTNYLAQSGIKLRNFAIEAINDSIFTLNSRATNLSMGETRMDTIRFNVRQQGNRLNYTGRLRNRPGTLDQWASVDLDGYFRPGRLGMDFHQRDIKGKTGFELGAYIDLNPDSTATLHLSPLDPTIGGQQWLVNEDNFINYNFVTRHVDANLKMRSDISALDLYTEHAASHDDADHDDRENLVLNLSDIRIQDWITLNPFAPPVKGNISANMKLNYNHNRLVANGDLSLADLYYGRRKVGDFRADVDMHTAPGGELNAKLGLWVDGKKSLTISGAMNDSTSSSPFLLDMSMIHFPLSTVNPFIPDLAYMTGTLNGTMTIAGSMEKPRLDGYLQFDSAAVRVNMLGTTFRFAPDSIPVVANRLRIADFAITACNDNPLLISGSADISSLSDIALDLALKANNTQIVNSQRAAKGADVYGKAFIDLDATAKGSLAALDLDAKLRLNSGTNVTYVMSDAESAIQYQATDNMVRFVNFNDSSAVAAADSLVNTGMSMSIDALLTIASGTTVNIDLDSKGQNKVQLQSQGTLNYTLKPMATDGRLTGRLNINSGFVRYTPPLMSEKLFRFNDNSYIAFNGDMFNPLLNIHADDRMRANVTQEGQNSRLIYFDVSLAVTGSLENMDVVFDLSTNDDVTIANELQSMSPTQRASQAMNLLLYNVYTGPGTKANANLSGNPLYSFLTSQLNSWAANTIKGVDLSFGIDQYDRTNQGVSHQTTSYSYRVSKSLFNDRFKVSVGGNYSTDADADQNLAQNLFNDISIEYTLNKAGTMYVKIFRHTGFESILEGEITSTGVGFVYKRKIRRLGDMFRFRRRKKLQQSSFSSENFTPVTLPEAPAATNPSTKSDDNDSIPNP